MPRQRVRARSAPLTLVGLALVVVLAAALVWYGLMTLLLALGVSPATIQTISGYRSVFDSLAGLTPADIDSTFRLIAAAAGVLTFVIFGFAFIKSLPRPYLARQGFELADDESGRLTVDARALERLAEICADSHPVVDSSRGRATERRIELDLTLRRADRLDSDLAEIRDRVREAIAEHGLPARPIDLTIVSFNTTTRRELV